jgi:cytoskeletal protein CcmA (bactofilin family)
VVAAGSQVVISAPVAGDVIAAGESVTITVAVGDDVRMAGQSLALDSRVGGHVVAAGNSISIGKSAAIADWLWIAGNSVVVAGRVGDELRVAGSNVVISGQIEGDVDVAAENLEITAGARISGDLIWRGPTPPEISPEAVISGQIRERALPIQQEGGVGGRLFFLAAVILAVAVLLWLFPDASVGIATRIRAEPLKSLGTGLLLLLLVPLVAVLLTVTGVGAILGVGTLLAYLLLILAGWLLAIAAVGLIGLDALGRSRSGLGFRVLAGAITAVVLVLVGLIPVLGGLVGFAVVLLGVGALGLHLAQLRGHAPS